MTQPENPAPEYVVVSDGQDLLTERILDYLDRTYGMPAKDIRAVALQSEAGQLQLLTVTLMVRKGVPDVL